MASGTSRKPSSMLVREMVSYAPIPSTDSMVWFGWASVAEGRAWTMASVPARDDFQKSDELKDLITKSNAILQKQGKGGGKSKAAGRPASC